MTIFFKLLIGCVILFILGSIGCVPPPTPAPAPTSTSVPTAVAIATATEMQKPRPTATLTPTATQTATNTITPTETLSPSATPTEIGRIEIVNLRQEFRGFSTFRATFQWDGCSSYLDEFQSHNLIFDGKIYQYCYSRIFENVDALSILTMPNPTELTDETGRSLRLVRGNQYGLIYWRRVDGTRLVLPFIYPRVYKNAQVVPIIKSQGSKPANSISNWQVWLIDPATGNVIEKIANPFVQLANNEEVVFNPITGFLEVHDNTGQNSQKRQIGLQLKPRNKPVAIIEGISFYGDFSNEDVAILQDALILLKTKTPNWLQYLKNQMYFQVVTDLIHPYYSTAYSKNSDTGIISWGEHPSSMQPREFALIFVAGTLIHEATHVRDLRQGKSFLHLPQTRGECIISERSAVEVQNAYLRDLLSIDLANNRSSQSVFESQIRAYMADNESYANSPPQCEKLSK